MVVRLEHLRRRVQDFLRLSLWDQDISQMPWWRAYAYRQLRVGSIFVRGFVEGRIQVRASAMTFTTLLTLGPVLILALTICQTFGLLTGLQSQIEGFLIDNLSPGSQEQIRGWLHRFFEAVRSGAFSGLSILVLFGGVLGLLGSIEAAFNDIWGVHRGRPLPQRLAIYLTMVVAGPILIGLSLSFTAGLESSVLKSWFASRSPVVEQLLQVGFRLSPLLLTGVALTLLYTVMPNVRVRLRAALPAGLLAALLWEFSKFGYRWYIHRASHYGTIFGSLAAFPFFLLWVYVSWLVVLFGAQLAFARDAAHDFRLEEGAMTASPRERLRVAFHLALAAARNYRSALAPPELVQLSHHLDLPLRLVHSVAEDLSDGGILYLVPLEERVFGLVPARSPERITAYDIIDCLQRRGELSLPASHGPGPAATPVDQFISSLEQNLQKLYGTSSLADILDEQDHLVGQAVAPGKTSP